MGTIAGDDTIFCVVKNESRAIKLTENLKMLFSLKKLGELCLKNYM